MTDDHFERLGIQIAGSAIKVANRVIEALIHAQPNEDTDYGIFYVRSVEIAWTDGHQSEVCLYITPDEAEGKTYDAWTPARVEEVVTQVLGTNTSGDSGATEVKGDLVEWALEREDRMGKEWEPEVFSSREAAISVMDARNREYPGPRWVLLNRYVTRWGPVAQVDGVSISPDEAAHHTGQ